MNVTGSYLPEPRFFCTPVTSASRKMDSGELGPGQLSFTPESPICRRPIELAGNTHSKANFNLLGLAADQDLTHGNWSKSSYERS
jgi:hypothetical protein